MMVISHITQFDVEGNCCFVYNSGCEENIEDTYRTLACLQRDGSLQPAVHLQSPMSGLDAFFSTKYLLLH